jgi:hypothetical protein
MRDFGLPMRVIMDELPMAQGWALISWATEHNGVAPVDRVSPGYIAQQAGYV